MQNFQLLFESSPWFLLLCVIAGALYAFLLYQRQGPWSREMNYLLTALRFTLVSALAFLLVGPFLKQIRNTTEKPSVIIAVDNSASVKEGTDSLALQKLSGQLNQLKASLEKENFSISFRTLQQNDYQPTLDKLEFDYPSSNLNQLLQSIQQDYEGRNLDAVVLVSDGIYNQGISPAYSPFNFELHTLALGDTTPKKDINLRALYYNKIAYQGNKYPLIAEISNNGFTNERIKLQVRKNGQILASKTLKLKPEQQVSQVEFILEAKQQGMQRLTVEALPLEGEYTKKNNLRDAFVDIVEGKEKILLVALSPHPDIKAIRNALDKKPNYDFKLYIPGINKFKKDKYDLVIFHQVPNLNKNGLEVVKESISDQTSLWFVLGSQSNLSRFNANNKVLKLQAVNRQVDEVTPSFNPDFDIFNFEEAHRSLINTYPPVTVPFGNIDLSPDAQILLYQKVGNIITSKPLLIVSGQRKPKTAIMIGEGMWKWRLQEFARTEKHEVFDEMISKLVQYLSAKEDKRKFKVYPVKKEFDNTEPVVFESEIYNDIYERVYGQKINLTITAPDKSTKQYSFISNKNNSQYRISGLEAGVYEYKATANIEGKTESTTGIFTVESLQLEMINITANFQLLKNMSQQSGGDFYTLQQSEQLKEKLESKEAQGVIHSNESYLPLIEKKFILFILLFLVSMEWFLRKYKGSY